jgi:hypothetical protein
MKEADWIHQSIPTSAHPLTNGDFGVRSHGHGFDWVISSVDGVTMDQFPPQKELRLNFSGRQPEQCELLRRYIPVEPGSEYRMEWKARADQIEIPSGLMWHMRCAGESACPTLESGDLLNGSDGIWRFRAPDSRLCVLTLDYARPTGAVTANGTVTLSSVSISRQRTDNSSLELKQ